MASHTYFSDEADLQPAAGDDLRPAAAGGVGDEGQTPFRIDMLSDGGLDVSGDAPRRSLPTHSLILGVAVLAAVGGIFAMRKLGAGPSTALADVKIEYDLNTARDDLAKQEVLLYQLNTATTVTQVPAENVQKNPFRMAEGLMGAEADLDSTDPEAMRRALQAEERQRAEEAQRRQALTDQLSNLAINSIIAGPVPLARISDKTYRVGDLVDETFTVLAIHQRSVDLELDGKTYTLSIDDQTNTKSAPRPRPRRRPN